MSETYFQSDSSPHQLESGTFITACICSYLFRVSGEFLFNLLQFLLGLLHFSRQCSAATSTKRLEFVILNCNVL